MAIAFQENDTAQACALNNYCSTVGGTIEAGRQAEEGVGAGSSEVTFTVALSQADDNEFSFELVFGNDVDGDSGTWTVRANFTTGNANATWESCFICRVSSGCVDQETIGSTTGLGIDTSLGAASTTVSGSAVTLADGDKVIITLGFSNSNAHQNRTVGITPDRIIDSPFSVAAVIQPHFEFRVPEFA